MQETLYSSKYLKIWLDTKNKMFIQEWFEPSKQMPHEVYKKEITAFRDLLKKHSHIKKSLAYTEHFYFIITPELQRWVADLFEGCEPQFIGMVVSEGYFSQLSIQNCLKQIRYGNETRYFNKREEAFDWLHSVGRI